MVRYDRQSDCEAVIATDLEDVAYAAKIFLHSPLKSAMARCSAAAHALSWVGVN